MGIDLDQPTPPDPWWFRRWREVVYDALQTPPLPRGPARILIPRAQLAVMLSLPTPPGTLSPLSSRLSCAPPLKRRDGRKPPSPAPSE